MSSSSCETTWESIKRPFHTLSMGLLFLLSTVVWAAPINDVFTYHQPDGSTLQVKVVGDEFFAEEETLEGQRVIRDPDSKFLCYARLSEDGQTLQSTGIVARDIDPTSATVRSRPEHLRLKTPRGQRIRIANENRERLGRDAKGRVIVRQTQSETDLSRERQTTPGTSRSVFGGPTVGNKKGLTLLIRFPDQPGDVSITRDQIDRFSNQMSPHCTEFGNNGSVAEYFSDVSNGKVTYTCTVADYHTAKHNRDYYTDQSLGMQPRARELIREALDDLEATNFDFRTVDTDEKGSIKYLNCFYAGPCVNDWSTGLWPHMGSCVEWTSAKTGIKADLYQITNMGTSLTLGIFCHENGHMLCGFPDVYDYDSGSEASEGGAGLLCLMNFGGHGTNPCPPSAYLRYKAGWGSAEPITASTHASKTLIAESNGRLANQFLIYTNPADSREYFIIENRYKNDRDAELPSEGIAIWHVDERGNGNNQNWTHQSAHTNYEVALIQADNQRHFERYVNGGDVNDLFFAGNSANGYSNQFDDTSDSGPYDNNAHWWNGSNSDMKLSHFSAPGNTMSLNVGQPSNVEITISPASTTLTPGSTKQYTATVSGTSNTAVIWSCTGGSVSPTGFYTAPSTAGNYMVTAICGVDNSTSASATVTVTSDGGGDPTTFNEVEGNDSLSTANAVTDIVTKITGFISTKTDVDIFKVNLDAGVLITVHMTGPALDYDLLITNASGSQAMGSVGSSSTETVYYRNSGTEPIDLYIQVKGYNGACTTTTPYNLVLSRSDSDVQVTISPISVTIQTGATQQFTATVSRSNPAVIWNCTGGSINPSGLYTAPSTAGKYTVTATIAADNSKFAFATVTVTSSGDGGGGGGGGGSAYTHNEVEPNDSFSFANAVPDSATKIVGTLGSSADNDYFKVKAGPGETLTVDMTGPIGKDYDLVLYDSYGNPVTSSTGKTATESVSYENTSSSAVFYTIWIFGYMGAYSSNTPYNLVLTRSATPATVSITINPTSAMVETGATQQFTTIVIGTSNTAVTWAVIPATMGVITPSGLFTAVTAGSCKVRATSVACSTKSAEATVTVTSGGGGNSACINLEDDLRNRLSNAIDGEVITLCEGTINVHGELASSANNIKINVVNSGQCILNQIGSGRIMNLLGNGVLVEGITFQNGNSSGNGGGLSLQGSGNQVINCNFIGNRGQDGGGLYTLQTLTITGSTFRGNTASLRGGAIFAGTYIQTSNISGSANYAAQCSDIYYKGNGSCACLY